MVRGFFETKLFSRKLDRINDPELAVQIEQVLSVNPNVGDLIPGLNGIRKVRIGGKGKGKSGGYRVIYVDLPKLGRIYLLTMYSKGEKANLTSEDKKVLKKIMKEIRK